MARHRSVGALVVLAALASCSGSQQNVRPSGDTLRPLDEQRAMGEIMDTLGELGVSAEVNHHIHLTATKEMDVDIAFAGSHHGIEWVDGQDREDLGDALPQASTPDHLVEATGTAPDQDFTFLVLDDRSFMYEPDPALASEGHPLVQEVLDRVHRATVDYVEYLRDHHLM